MTEAAKKQRDSERQLRGSSTKKKPSSSRRDIDIIDKLDASGIIGSRYSHPSFTSGCLT